MFVLEIVNNLEYKKNIFNFCVFMYKWMEHVCACVSYVHKCTVDPTCEWANTIGWHWMSYTVTPTDCFEKGPAMEPGSWMLDNSWKFSSSHSPQAWGVWVYGHTHGFMRVLRMSTHILILLNSKWHTSSTASAFYICIAFIMTF